MKKFLIFFLILFCAIWLGVKISADPGYFLMAYDHWTIEMPLWLGVLLILVFNFVLFWLIFFVRRSRRIPQRLRFWSRQRALRIAQQHTNKGLIALAEGDWKQAEKWLIRAAAKLENPLINYLAAAQAAQSLSAYDRRDLYLSKAHAANPEAEIAVGLTQAQLQLNYKQYEQALATLKHLKDLAPNHQYILKLLKKVYITLSDWQGLEEIYPAIKKSKIINSEELQALEAQIFINLLKQKIYANKNELEPYWDNLPKHIKYNEEIVILMANYFMNSQQNDKAENILRSFLKKKIMDSVIYLYGQVNHDLKKQSDFLELIYKSNKQNVSLLYVLGKLYCKQSLWGKAKQYLDTALAMQTAPELYLELAKVYEGMNNTQEALNCYQKALQEQAILI